LKPANVMVGRFGEVYVLDWGLCRVSGTPDDLPTEDEEPEVVAGEALKIRTARGALVGTPIYMSPEQASGKPDSIGPYSDQFGLGLILYELVTLELAFPDSTLQKVLERITQARKAEPSDEADLPRELGAIIDKATALRPKDRYASVRDLATDLRRYLRGKQTEALPDNALRSARRWVRGHSERVVLVAILLLVGIVGLAAWRAHQRRLAASQAQVEALERKEADDALMVALTERAERISSHFLWYEAEVEGLAGAASFALLNGTSSGEPRYRPEDFAKAETAPPDLKFSAHYGGKISPSWPVYRMAPDADAALAEEQSGRLGGLRPWFIDMFRAGPESTSSPADEEERRARLLAHAVPIEWAYLALESTGLIVAFPGSRAARWTDGFDPRARSWYQAAKDAASRGRLRLWSTPYVDLLARGLVITCTRATLNADGSLQAVVALDLGFDDVAKRYLTPGGSAPFRRAVLLDKTGQVVLANDAPALAPGEEFSPRPYRHAKVLEAIKAGPTHGLMRVSDPTAGSLRVAWHRLGTLEWTLVVEALEAGR
jgi:serine/threonine-protein kinase